MKGELTIKILDALESAALATNELLGVFLCDYHESYRRARKLAYGHDLYKSAAELKKERDQRVSMPASRCSKKREDWANQHQ